MKIKELVQTIFSVRNQYEAPDTKRKLITILGVKVKCSRQKHNGATGHNNNPELQIAQELIQQLQHDKESLVREVQKLQYDKYIAAQENESLLYNYAQKSISDKINIYYLNDTKQYEPVHLGCSCISDTFRTLCAKNNMSIFFSDGCLDAMDGNVEKYKAIMKKCDILILNGEGTLHEDCPRMHTLMKKCELAKSLGKKVVLINTVWQRNPTLYKYLPLFDIISTRESFSKKEMLKSIDVPVRVVPDLTFYVNGTPRSAPDNPCCIFTDSCLPNITSKLKEIAQKHNAPFYYMEGTTAPSLTLEALTNATHVITGRFHCLALCIKLGIPCLALPSNTHKTHGLLNDAQLLDYYLADPNQDLENKIGAFLSEDGDNFKTKALQYSITARDSIDILFEDIKNLLS